MDDLSDEENELDDEVSVFDVFQKAGTRLNVSCGILRYTTSPNAESTFSSRLVDASPNKKKRTM
jgi:hypothetical protein